MEQIQTLVDRQDVKSLKNEQLLNSSTYGLKAIGQVTIQDTCDIRSSRIGIGFETLDRFMFDPERVYPHLKKLGAKWARVQTGWSRCEVTKGNYDFTWLEEVVENLIAIGVEPFFSLTFGNILYTTDAAHESAVGYVPLYYGKEGVIAWCNYVHALANVFRDRVRYWEVWNEPNIGQFWHPETPNAEDYAKLVKLTAEAVHSAHPNARIVGGAMSKLDSYYLENALKAGMADHIDAFSFHPYQLVPEDNLDNMYKLLRRLIDRYAKGKRIEIWQGENGCPSQTKGHNDDWLGLYNTDQIVQAKWISRRILSDLRTGFDLALYFHAVDLMGSPYRQSDGKERQPVMMGLIHGDTYQPKYSFEVLQRVCTLFDDDSVPQEFYIQFNEPDPENPQQCSMMGSPTTACFARNGVPLMAYWLSEDPQQKKPAREIDLIFWCDGDLTFTHPVLVDIMTGTIFDLKEHFTPYAKSRPMVGQRCRLPITDYPLILSDASAFPHIAIQ